MVALASGGITTTMFRAFSRRHRAASPALALWLAMAMGGQPAAAAPFEVLDTEGFGESLTAITIDLPDGWQAQGRVAWLKPCSASDMYEIVLSATSPDGRSGIRMVPGHQIVWTGVDVTGVDPTFAQMSVAQAEQSRADLQGQFRESNCHVGRVAGTAEIVERLVLARRPAGARVIASTPNETQIAAFRQSLGPQTPGLRVDFDAVILELGYPGAAGEMRERLWLSWYRFRDDPTVNRIPGMPHFVFETVTVEGMTFTWAPTERAEGDLAAAAAAIAGARANPDWLTRVRAEQQRRAEERRRLQAETEADRRAREAARDRQHEQFLDMIRN